MLTRCSRVAQTRWWVGSSKKGKGLRSRAVRKAYGPPQVTAYELRPGETLTVWRIVRSEHHDDPVFVNSFRSHYELSEEPRQVERTSSVLHMGISTYLEESVAHGTAQRFRKLGDWVARLDLQPGNGFNYAHTGHRLHLTIWGDAIMLSNATVDTNPVSE